MHSWQEAWLQQALRDENVPNEFREQRVDWYAKNIYQASSMYKAHGTYKVRVMSDIHPH